MTSDNRLRRCLLFMPGDDRKKIEKGIALQPDAIIMDLEDGVAISQKKAARLQVADALRELDFGRSERWVRINQTGSGLEDEDVWQVAPAAPNGVVMPKVNSAGDILWLGQRLNVVEDAQHWPRNSIKILGIIETALGVINLPQIAAALPERLVALAFGAEDLASDIGALRTPSGHEVSYARQMVVLHAAAYGLQAIDTPHVNLQDLQGLSEQTQLARELGYTGKLAIHPSQIEPLQTLFSPTADQIAYAQALVDAYAQHQVAGSGVFVFQSKMIDTPMLLAAERVLAQAAAAGLL